MNLPGSDRPSRGDWSARPGHRGPGRRGARHANQTSTAAATTASGAQSTDQWKPVTAIWSAKAEDDGQQRGDGTGEKSSGPCRDRTDDIYGVNVALYQLS